jgi:hypothetical protein
MNDNTFKILDAALRADVSIPHAERTRILKTARNGAASTPAENETGHGPTIYSRAEVARRLGDKTPRYVDQLCKRGLLQKFTPKGNRRAIGVCGESLRAFIAGK